MKPWVKHLGSSIAIGLGVLSLVSGLAQIGNGKGDKSDLVLFGTVTLLGALAYRSAKKRKLGQVPDTRARLAGELLAIGLLIAAVGLQNRLVDRMVTEPVANLLAPAWALVAYIAISARRGAIAPVERERGQEGPSRAL